MESNSWFSGEVDHDVVRQMVRIKHLQLAGTGDDLVKRFLNGFVSVKGKLGGEYLWFKVSQAFGHGSNVSIEICRKYGFDPDARVKQRKI